MNAWQFSDFHDKNIFLTFMKFNKNDSSFARRFQFYFVSGVDPVDATSTKFIAGNKF